MNATLATNKNSEKQHWGPRDGIFSPPPQIPNNNFKKIILIISIFPWWGLASKI